MKIRITLAFATRGLQQETVIEVPSGTTVQQGLAILADTIAALTKAEETLSAGVWGKIRPAHYVLREGDRIELYRPLKADPKQARRSRAGTGTKRG